MDTQTQIERLIELAIVQRTELKELVAQLPQLREHLSTEIEKAFDEAEPQLRAELEEWTTKEAADKTAALGVALEAKIVELSKNLEISTQARYNAIIAEREENARLSAQAEAKIAEHAATLPSAVKEIVSAELARFPRAGEIDQLRKEFAEPRGLNPRGKWQSGESYSKLDFVTINGDSYASNIDNNRTRPSRSSADWTLVAARGTGGGGGPTSLSELTTVPSDGDVLIGSGTSWVTSNLTAGAGISITVGPGAITISATDGDITLDDGTAASPSLHFTNDPDTGIYRPAANTLGISTSGVQRMYVDENGITTVGAGATFDGSVHAANGNANNPSLSFTGDQDTGFFRHQPNEIGIALGGTQYATLTSTTFSITPVVTMASSLRVNGTTDSSNKDTGAIVTEGGLGVEKSATIGGNLTVSGTGGLILSSASPTVSSSATNASLNYSANGTGNHLFNNAVNVNGVNGVGKLNVRVDTDANAHFRPGTAIGDGTAVFIDSLNDANNAVVGLTLRGSTVKIRDGSGVNATFTGGNATLAGNLTVSGTGTSAFSGQISSTSAATASGDLRLNHSAGGKVIRWASANYNVDLYQSGDNDILRTRVANFQISSDPTFASNFTTIAAGNITTTGNLTVNGTGNSTFAGSIRLPWSTPSLLSYYDATYSLGFVFDSTNRKLVLRAQSADAPANGKGTIAFESGATPSEIARFAPSTGNLLLGTTTDGGQKLQVSGDAAFAGDRVINRKDQNAVTRLQVRNDTSGTAGQAQISATVGDFTTYTVFGQLSAGFTSTGLYQANSGYFVGSNALYIFTASASSLVLGTNNTTALTLDSSQNATFAGTVRTTALGIGTAPNSYYTIIGANTLTGNPNQAFLNAAPTFDSGATGQGNVLWLQGKTAAASYTLTALSGIKIESPSLGAGSSVTTVYGLRILAQTGGTTNYAIYTDGGYIRFGSLPTSSAGLPSGTVWNDGGTLKIA